MVVRKSKHRKWIVMAAIAVLGGGSLGLLLAGRLTAAGCNCELWTKTLHQASLLNHEGLTIQDPSGETLAKVTVKAASLTEVLSKFENGPILLTVKQTALTPDFLQKLAYIIPFNGTLVLFQNGIGHVELLRQALPGRRLITAVTTEGALRISEVIVRHTGEGEIRLGEWFPDGDAEISGNSHIDGDIANEALLQVEQLLKQAGFSVLLSKQLEDVVLRKLLINAVINPLTAILRIRNGELTETADRKRLMQALFHETFGILSHYGLKDESKLWETVLRVCHTTYSNESSMLQDINLHKETEIEFINGAICRMAIRQGIEAPWNQAVMALVKAAH
ncbi:ketopantoate reductase family protein [Cohnella sp.]|uniref:ketopantoate reductase family protein n=1 Tax=Cohnella sp. TaxID=1883426 RepID=UPI0035622583